MYDYLIVGSGLFGSVFAHEMTEKGYKCLVIEKKKHTGGLVHCEEKEGICIHKYGPHIFHTSSQRIWKYVNRFVDFNKYVHTPIANYKGKLYNLPFNMYTFYEMWGIMSPVAAMAKINREAKDAGIAEPKNLEEKAISMVGTEIYESLIKGYTTKQWGRSCTELPAEIIERLPVRFTFDNRYFNDRWQGVAKGCCGYNRLIDNLLRGIEVITGIEFLDHRKVLMRLARKIVYTGPIDEYYDYVFGPLEYRGLRFETERVQRFSVQGVAVMNYTDLNTPFTRIIEHKHFAGGTQDYTYVTKEYPERWEPGKEAYYPVNDRSNQDLYAKYARYAVSEPNVVFGGRLGEYKYYDMDDVIESALHLVERLK